MGWRFKWVSSHDSDFNFDYNVSFTQDDLAKGKVFYNYRMTDASIEELPASVSFTMNATATSSIPILSTLVETSRWSARTMYLDLTPKGRNETGPITT